MQNMAYFYESMCSRDSWGRTFGDGQCSNQEGGNRSWNGAMPQGWGRRLPFVLVGLQPCLACLVVVAQSAPLRRDAGFAALGVRSEARRVGKESVSTCRARGSPCH